MEIFGANEALRIMRDDLYIRWTKIENHHVKMIVGTKYPMRGKYGVIITPFNVIHLVSHNAVLIDLTIEVSELSTKFDQTNLIGLFDPEAKKIFEKDPNDHWGMGL